jgi:hypothetical protein
MPATPEMLRPVDKDILDLLHDGRVTPAFVRHNLGNKPDSDDEYSRQYLQQRLVWLKQHGHVESLPGGMYELISDPREQEAADE